MKFTMPECKHDWRDREAAGMGALGTICELCAVQRIAKLEEALKCLLPGLVLDLRYADDDDDKDALRNRIDTIETALGLSS